MNVDGDSLARPLGGGEIGPVELPPKTLRPERDTTRARWYGLAAFAMFGTTAILVVTGRSDLGGIEARATLPWAPLEAPLTGHPPDDMRVYPIAIDGLPALGTADAKVTLVAVTDYACGGCERTRAVLQALRGSYGEELRIVWKPALATPAAAGACAAALQGEHARFDEALWRAGFERVGEGLRPLPLPDESAPDCASSLGGCTALSRMARELGLDTQRFASGVKRCAATVRASQAEIEALQVSTPAFFVNGRRVDPWGLDNPNTFHTLIDVELAKARRRIAAGASQARYYQQWVLEASGP